MPSKRCTTEDLAGSAAFGPDKYNPTPGPIDGVLFLTLKDGSEPCTVSPMQPITMSVRDGAALTMAISVPAYQADVIVQGQNKDLGDGARVLFVWANWCGDTAPITATLHLAIDGKGLLDVPIVASSGAALQTRFPRALIRPHRLF